MKITDNFHIEELVHPEYIIEHGAAKMAKVFKRYAPDTLEGLDTLREWLDEPITINDYKWAGSFINSGLRHPSDHLGSELSAHRFFLAMDCKFKGRTIKDAQEDILMNQDAHPLIARMEDYRDTPTWLHVQFGRRKPNQTIEVFRP
jgi:hypothetical protein